MDRALFKIRQVLAQNLKALMVGKHGPTTQLALAKVSKVAQATIGRILNAEVGASIDTLDNLAHAYELEGWQLLVAGMDPSNPPVLMPVSTQERALYEKLKEAAVGIAALERPRYDPK